MFNLDRDLIVIDVESSGTDSEKDSIIQLSAGIFTREGKISNYKMFDMYIKPYKFNWDDSAEKIHGLTVNFLNINGKDIAHALKSFLDWIPSECTNNYYIAYWGGGFDSQILKSAFTECLIPYPFSYRTYDIASIVRFYLACKGVSSASKLEDCSKVLKIFTDNLKSHNAKDDVIMAMKCLEKVKTCVPE